MMKHFLMKLKSYIILLPFLILACSSKENTAVKEDLILTISGESKSSSDCSRKCIRISSINVQKDDCYDEDARVFTKDCESEVSEDPFFSELLQVKATYWEAIENETDANSSEDAGLPFIVTLTNKEETTSYVLLRINKYPTKEYAAFMKQVALLFDKWEDCKSE